MISMSSFDDLMAQGLETGALRLGTYRVEVFNFASFSVWNWNRSFGL